MESETNFCVYMHTNRFNGKKYIGITGQKPTRRWHNGWGYVECPAFFNAIKKYGWDAFQHEILYTELTREQAAQLEVEMIAKYQTQNPEKGYNLSEGGTHPVMTAETRAKMGASRKGRVVTAETRQKISNTLKGHGFAPETLEKMSTAKKGKKLTLEERQRLSAVNSIPVLCVETGVVYPSAAAAAKAVSTSAARISECRRGKRHTAGGYHWRYTDEAVMVDG